MSIGRICRRRIDLVDQDESVREAARRMREREVGFLVAIDSRGRPVGVLTERDLVGRVLADGHDPASMRVRAVMTPNPNTIAVEAPIETAVSLMMFGAVRRLPVVDQAGKVVGIVTLDDVTALLAEEFSMIGKLLESHMPYRRAFGDAASPSISRDTPAVS